MKKYCLDTNIFIEPWNRFYSTKFTKGYWETLADLAQKDILFSTDEVKKEIEKIDDDLLKWIKNKNFFKSPDEAVQKQVTEILKKYPNLIDNSKGRSMADPWVIAHAKSRNAVVVTLEQKSRKSGQVKIPDVCSQEKIECIDIYDLIQHLKIEFMAKIKNKKNGTS